MFLSVIFSQFVLPIFLNPKSKFMSSTTSLPPANAHFISIQTAATMTASYRSNRETILASIYKNQDILPLSETFNRDLFDELLSKTGCEGIRIYYGMDEYLKVHAIIVAVDEDNNDILPQPTNGEEEEEEEEDFIGEEGQRCPNLCPPTSSLNN